MRGRWQRLGERQCRPGRLAWVEGKVTDLKYLGSRKAGPGDDSDTAGSDIKNGSLGVAFVLADTYSSPTKRQALFWNFMEGPLFTPHRTPVGEVTGGHPPARSHFTLVRMLGQRDCPGLSHASFPWGTALADQRSREGRKAGRLHHGADSESVRIMTGMKP